MKNKIRIIFQSISLTLILYVAVRPFIDKSYIADFEKYCPYGGISSLFSKLNQGTMACNMSETQVMLGLGLLAGAGLVGKLFCSFICPIGSVSEWIGLLGDKLKIRKEMPKIADRYLRAFKYIILFVSIYFTMTTSELFCKKFDPYFASANLFGNSDIVLYLAIPAFLITIAGALFFRLFWCKYLCPLGAMSNIFMNVAGAIGTISIYLAANYFGAGLGFVWLLGGLVLMGLINELGFMKSFMLPAPKIRRSEVSCSSCGLCDKECPQGIKISTMPVVKHIDCNLCSDCVNACPLKNVLAINKKKSYKHLAPAAVVILIAISFGFSYLFEFTTISMKWGKPIKSSAVYTQTGIKSIKCYGSSMALAGTLEDIEGIYGLDTYANSHTVKIYYDPSVISERKVKEALFSPIKMEIRDIEEPKLDSVAVLRIGVNGLFDALDFDNLFLTLKEKKGIYSFETHFGEPVYAVIYYNPNKLSSAEIKQQLGKESITIKKDGGSEKIELSFKPENNKSIDSKISVTEYRKRIFNTYDETFNGYEEYNLNKLSVYIVSIPEAGETKYKEDLANLANHLSGDEGIVRFSTRFEGEPSGLVYFDAAKTNVETILSGLTDKKFKFYVSDTEIEEVKNPFTIKAGGRVVKASETKIDEKFE